MALKDKKMLEAYEVSKSIDSDSFEFEHNYTALRAVCSILDAEESCFQNVHKGNVCFLCDSGVYGCMEASEFEKLIS